jgi:hypothetical protein
MARTSRKIQRWAASGDPKRIPFDFAQGRLSCVTALGRRNDNGVSIGFVRVSSKAKWTVVENALRFGE